MLKVKLGPAVFREKPTEDNPHPIEQACMVVAKHLDGTARIVVWEIEGSTFILDHADLIQKNGEVEAHYEECFHDCCPQPQPPAKNDPPLPAKEEKAPDPQEPATGPGGDLPHDVPLTA